MTRPAAQVLRGIDQIIAGLKLIDGGYSALPAEAKAAVDGSTLADLDAAGLAKLANQITDMEAA